MERLFMKLIHLAVLIMLIGGITGCASKNVVKAMETTGYCACGKCCSWERGSWKYLKLDFWNRYNSAGKRKGWYYSGKTASGTMPHEPTPGLFSVDSLKKPWMIPFRIIFPWLWFSEDGTIAADTRYNPFGTRMYIPGYGYGVVEDRGGAIKGAKRLDLYYDSHNEALQWGRKKVKVTFLK